jgi:peptide/nickel transport system permease protein
MSQAAAPVGAEVTPQKAKRTGAPDTLVRVSKYTLTRTVALFITVVIGVYLTILIANMGGHVDNIRRSQIREEVGLMSMADEIRKLPTAEREAWTAEQIRIREERLGLDQPFVVRSFRFLASALTLDLGRAEYVLSDSGSSLVRNIILERLPPTLLLMATSNLLLFFLSVFFALYLSRNYGSILDKMVITLSPTSSAPAWFYGLFLILVFAAVLGVLPFGGMVKAPPPEDKLEYALSLLNHLILPVSAWLVSGFFSGVYAWRTFFLIFSSEDYVEMAKAKGLTSREIERRYILRPTLPNIITNFMLLLIALWTGAIILETVFNWPGLGRLFFRAIGAYDTPVIVGNTVIYAYLLAITVFLLDFLYALVDPRVKVGG